MYQYIFKFRFDHVRVPFAQTEAENQPSDSQRKLLAAAKLLADATARMVEAARLCASLPQVHTHTQTDRERGTCLRSE